ncbi:zinc metalloproteinase nas-15-like [Macrosteles quadrilineatus]|uniref:zinc metalloproteinase nas-15-like n=1 Tax=Macrosteles quadrilineatus TaxID=74068 RepID=UPI0023E30EC1|nr:zinc metalloproteinase nas-15-like [Macrosteles quadrilineatus]XP_054265088.1 zinc metalloproteinase nas-15-like [Macrosteles quadrilineatus]
MRTVVVLVFLLQVVLVWTSPAPSPFWENFIQEDETEADEGLTEQLMEIGESLFGMPKTESGDAVSRWSPEMDLNPEELGEYAQGDLLIPATSEREARNGLKAASTHWPKGIVPYEISPYFNQRDQSMINEAIAEYRKLTCVKWVPRTGSERDYVYITNSNTGCWSSVGRIGGRQELNLQSPGCLTKKGTVMHEMMHAIGFLHEQNRWERDKHVTVNYQNIQSGRENNFEKAKKKETDNQGVAYDYRSVMHYSANAFSRNGQPTIVPKTRGVTLGQRENLSRKDVQKIRHMYKCK